MQRRVPEVSAYALALSMTVAVAHTTTSAAEIPSPTKCQPPSWINDPDVPECPTSGSTLLPETAPAAAIVISKLKGWSLDPRTKKPVQGDAPLAQFVLDTLRAAGTKTPKIFLKGVEMDTLADIHKQIDTHCADPRNKCQALKAMWQAALIGVPGKSFQWQQDYFQSTFDPSTGLPVIRPIRGYDNDGFNVGAEVKQLATAAQSFCIGTGTPLPPETEKNYQFDNWAMGGNIEGLPGGLCLHGNNQDWKTFGRHYCGDKSNSVEIDVKWLGVGHVDEVIGVVPDRSAQAPCDFAITWASPKKAFELMKSPKNQNQPFFEFFKNRTFAKQLAFEGVQELCWSVDELRSNRGRAPRPGTDKMSETSRGASLLPHHLPRQWMQLMIESAQASAEEDEESQDVCKGMSPPTNAEVAEVLERAGYNSLIQKKMESNQSTVLNRLKERTGCSTIQVTPVPNLFFGGEAIEARPDTILTLDGKPRLFGELSDQERERLPIDQRYVDIPKDRAVGLLPNPTNAVAIGNTVIGPKSWNQAFRSYLRESYKRLGQDFKEADTWSANENMGNLHCATNTLRVCRPVSKESRISR